MPALRASPKNFEANFAAILKGWKSFSPALTLSGYAG